MAMPAIFDWLSGEEAT